VRLSGIAGQAQLAVVRRSRTGATGGRPAQPDRRN
jgi:hypothetical protein